MLKEVFVLDSGILLFHYTADRAMADDDRAVLSGGLLSAIQDFSIHTRADALQSFFTENEYFLYARCPTDDRVLVGVFARSAPREYASEAMSRILEVVGGVQFPKGGQQLSPESKEGLSRQIDRINAALFTPEAVVKEEIARIAEEGKVVVGFAFRVPDGELIASFSRPRPLFKKDMVGDAALVHASLLGCLRTLGILDEYESFVMNVKDYTVAVVNCSPVVGVSVGPLTTPQADVFEAARRLCGGGATQRPQHSLEDGEVIGVLRLDNTGRIVGASGPRFSMGEQRLITRLNVFLSTLIKNLENLAKSLSRRSLDSFVSVVPGEVPHQVAIESQDSGYVVRLLRHT